ncbi:hypothetical protein DICPUDRAFT_53299 [Dictyostelium purpureum]|uniref:Chitin-binding type-4 domain-containing protein n=1 Tax=Dictyostelium purpureum TaxID=5786 RepID=F0ZC49_DICPU|nr:uncharacterized protein DICPUDRAFT_53299 [Dictyostelium purpureum]EGC38434.1 hypothetical protein DICPUDRAFT_53299 [Dictyostelium purpureum]|eukprot:XP_003284992.1 hypothetical protein DICPUDRAFT_53299 [Dictyostelium purpureum]
MLKLILIISFVVCFISLVNGHGYFVYPISRQQKCNKGAGSFWWPENGDGIADPACRAAFKYVYNKGGSGQYQFTQSNEYSVLIPNYAAGASALQTAVPKALCSAGNTVSPNDKSGMSIASNWSVTQIPAANGALTKTITAKFCATASHLPSFFEFYISKPGYNPATTELKWSDLTLFQTFQNPTLISMSDPNCGASNGYSFTLNLPTRFSNAVLLTRWQRVDPVGECFISCSDFKNIVQ